MLGLELLIAGLPISKEQFVELRKRYSGSNSDFTAIFAANVDAVLQSLSPFGSQAVSFLRTVGETAPLVEACENYLKILSLPDAVDGDVGSSELCLALYLTLCQDDSTANPLPTLLPLASESCGKTASLTLVMRAKKFPEETEKQASCYVTQVLATGPNISSSDFISLSSALELYMPLFTSSIKPIYTLKQCKEAFLFQAHAFKENLDERIAKAILAAVSASCIDEEARKFNTDTYLPFLVAGLDFVGSNLIAAMSLLCIVKLWNFSHIEQFITLLTVLQKTMDGFKTCEVQCKATEYFLEALAYLSLGNSAKTVLRTDEDFLNHLLLVLETTKENPNIYGVLLVYLNLSKVKDPAADKDTDTVNYLKGVSVPGKDNSKEDAEAISLFNERLVLEHKIVSSLSGLNMNQGNVASQTLRVLYSLALDPKREIQRAIVAQGGLNILLKYLTTYSTTEKSKNRTMAFSSDPGVIQTRTFAIRALAILCRSVDPKVAFSTFDVKTAVPFLVELFGLDSGEITSSQISATSSDARFAFESQLSILDKLCGLLALTNLSSESNNDLHLSIINRVFESHLKDLMLDTTLPDIQRATWELINNLIVNPAMLAKFFNLENAESLKNLTILVKMLHSRSERLQVVIAGLMANATMEYELVAQVIMTNVTNVFEPLLKIISDILRQQAQNDDLILRVCTLVLNLVEVAEGHKLESYKRFQEDKAFKSGLKTVVISTKNSDIMFTIRSIIETARLKF